MHLLMLLLMLPPPPDAETLQKYAVESPEFPPEATVYETQCGTRIGIVPEEPINEPLYRTETYTDWVSTCGMPCSVHVKAVQRTKRIPVGEAPLNRPTPLAEAEKVLLELKLTPQAVLYDLGSGDGRVCVLAAVLGAKAVGIDRRPEAIELARQNAVLNGVSESINWFAYDVFESKFSRPTVIFTFWKGGQMEKLKAYVEANATSHVRAYVSYQHEWPGVENEQVGDFFIWRPHKIARKDDYRAPVADCYAVGGT